jgi:hypothetical protein
MGLGDDDAGGWMCELKGAVAQLGEHLLCKQGVSGSIPLSSTIDLALAIGYCLACSVAGTGP